ncbi:MAG: non-ribosomal peptide synthetase [Vicinamibacterales bacterium]
MDASSDRPLLVRRPPQTPAPLSYAQHALWVAQQLHGPAAKYNVVTAWRLHGPVDRAALCRAINTIVERHESLRTRFDELDEEPVQIVCPAAPFDLSPEDLTGLDDVAQRRAVTQALDDEWAKPFDLRRAPLLRVRLLELGTVEHVLIQTAHHIVWDGWSRGVFARELSALYRAAHHEVPHGLAALEVQCADAAVWQRSRLTGPRLAHGLGYWNEQLANAPQELTLPSDRRRPAVRRQEGRALDVQLSPELIGAVTRFGQANRASLFTTLLAGFGALLARYTHACDIVVGTPVADRPDARLEPLIGLFTNELPIRMKIGPETTFRQLVNDVRETTLAAYRHKEVPFDRIVQELSPQRSRNAAPLFQVGFGLQDATSAALTLAGLDVEAWLRAERLRAKLDLEVQVLVDGDRARLYWLYDAELFGRARMEQMARHYRQLLDGLTADPDVPLHRLPIVSEEDRLALDGWQGAAHEIAPATIPELFEHQVDATPARIAVASGTESLSYADLDRLANAVAHRLRVCGVGPETIVAVCAERSPQLVAGLLAVLKAGGAYLPIDPAYPRDRIAFMLEDSGAAVVLAEPGTLERVVPGDRTIVNLDDYRCVTADQRHETRRLAHRATAANLAYVLYTSGSTGRPKAVMVSRGALANHMAWMNSHFPLDLHDRILQRTALSFDASVWEFYAPLLTGARLVLAPPESHPDGATLTRWMREEAITIVQMVPSLLRVLTEAPDLERCLSLRRVFCGGEPLTSELQQRVRARLPNVELHNLYGPTEATIDATWWPCASGTESEEPAIGRPVWNTRAYVVNAALQLAPAGVTGELCLAGAGLARGYLRRAALTAERFVPDPYCGRPGERMYRVGDLVRWRPDGALDFVARIDHQLKIRGLRIELGEIEAALRALPGVAQVVVVGREEEFAQARLVAYVVASTADVVTADTLRNRLRETLPDYMVPAAFVLLDALPLMPNGKIDRKALPAPEASAAGYRQPRTADERALCTIFAEVLGVDRVGLDDDFFAIGGHSLSAMRVIMRSRAQLGIPLSFRTMLEHGTVAAILQQVASASGEVAR